VTGSGHNTFYANVPHLLSAGRDVIVLIGGFAAIAAAISLTQVSRNSLTQVSRKPQLCANDGNARQADASRFVHKRNRASCTQRRLQ
jgi:thioredoxin reductase